MARRSVKDRKHALSANSHFKPTLTKYGCFVGELTFALNFASLRRNWIAFSFPILARFATHCGWGRRREGGGGCGKEKEVGLRRKKEAFAFAGRVRIGCHLHISYFGLEDRAKRAARERRPQRYLS